MVGRQSTGVIDGVTFPSEALKAFNLSEHVTHTMTVPGGLYNTSWFMVMNEDRWGDISPEDHAASRNLAFGLACTIVLLSMMCLTGADVVARYVFNVPIKGAFELIEVIMVVLIYLALPLAMLVNAHVEVELWEPKDNGSIRRV